MSTENFRVQFLRGTKAENDLYAGRDGEITIDSETRQVRIHDGTTPGGTALPNLTDIYTRAQVDQALSEIESGGGGVVNEALTVKALSYASGTFEAPTGVVVEKEYDNSSLKITHNKGKFPTGWFAFSRESSPMNAITATATRNMQIVDENTVIITNLSSFDAFDVSLHF